MHVSYHFYLNWKHSFIFLKLYAHNYQHVPIQIAYKIIIQVHVYDTASFLHGAATYYIYIHCLHLAKLNQILRIGDKHVAQ